MQTPIHQRATELVEKCGMPWSEAENLALSEFGITETDIDELKGECCSSPILTGDDISELIRSVLVHGAGLLVRNPEAVVVGSTPVEPETNDATFCAILFAFVRLSLVHPTEAQLHQLDRLITFYGDQKFASQLKLLAHQARTPNINRDVGRARPLVFSGSAGIGAQPSQARQLHPETASLMARFADALSAKLSKAEKKYGYTDGWRSPLWMDECRKHLREHIEKGDPLDVAAYCAFLWHHGEGTATPPAASES